MLALAAESFDSFIEQNPKIVIKFWAEWCAPCRRLDPVIEEIAGEMDDVTFASINADQAQELCQQLGIMSIPALLIAKHGGGQELVVAPRPIKADLKRQISTFMSGPGG